MPEHRLTYRLRQFGLRTRKFRRTAAAPVVLDLPAELVDRPTVEAFYLAIEDGTVPLKREVTEWLTASGTRWATGWDYDQPEYPMIRMSEADAVRFKLRWL